MAYQGFGQGADRAQIAALTGLLGLTPDLTLVLDVSPEVTAARIAARALPTDRYDRLGRGFHARVADGYRAIAAAEPERCRLIDANGDADSVFEAVSQAVAPLLAQARRP